MSCVRPFIHNFGILLSQSNPLSSFLHVTEPPYFVEKPQSQEVVPTARVQFKALVKGSTPLQIKWFKDSQELLSGANRSVWKDDTSSVLELFSARTSDSGNYTCQISNDVGTATCKATLFVKGVQLYVLLIVPLIFLCNLEGGGRKPLYFFKSPEYYKASPFLSIF